MKRSMLWILLNLMIILLLIAFGAYYKYIKVAADFSGIQVNDFVIQDGKTIPGVISDQKVDVDVNISLSKFFNFYKLTGEVKLNGVTYKILSSDQNNKGYVAGISSKPNKVEGFLKMSKNLSHFSLQLNEIGYIVFPADSNEEASKVVHKLYGS